MRKNAKKGHLRAMPYIHMGENWEKTECIGHEREAFENFAAYADTYEASPFFKYTKNFDDLSIHEKMEAYINKMDVMWKGKDSSAQIEKLRYCVKLAKCFEELCKKDQAQIADYTDDYQHRFYEVVEAACRIARKVNHAYPDAPAALLYIAKACVAVGEDNLEAKCLDLSSFLIGDVSEKAEEMFPEAQPDKVKAMLEEKARMSELSEKTDPKALS